MDPSESQYAGLDRRVAAYVVDVLLLYLAILGVQAGFNLATSGTLSRWLTTGQRIEAWVLLTVSLPTWAYFTFSESSGWQATLGKRLLKLQVTGLEGGRIGWGKALLRTVVKLLPWELTHLTILTPIPWFWDRTPGFRSGLVLVYALLGIYMVTMIFSTRKQGIHDWLARTVVTRTAVMT